MAGVDYVIVVIYLVLIVCIGMLLQRRASGDIDSYFLGNRGLPWWALGASGMASNLDVAGTMINTAWVFALGAAGLFLEIRGGVTLIMAFLMIFMGKWNRRAQVMTMAEWMEFRFGKGREGQTARLMSAISIIMITIAMITYFAVGSGKFISTFLGVPNLGRIVNPLTSDEIQQIDRNWEEVVFSAKRAQVMFAGQDIPEIAILERQVREVQEFWVQVRENPGKLQSIQRLEEQIGFLNTASASLDHRVDQPFVHRLTAQISSFTETLNQSMSYRIYVKAETLAALLMICLAMLYTVASGLYGVVWTDVFQGVLIFFTILFICVTAMLKFNLPEVFNISIPMRDGTFQAIQMSRDAWVKPWPSWQLHFPADSPYSVYNLFGIAILFYLIKVTIEGSGGTSGYMIQRYFASKSDRESGLLSLFWTFLLSFRWPFIVGIAIMGIVFGSSNGVISDPERVLPVVVNELIPTGIKGLLVAGLMAAAMSTFDSTVNAGAAYWVKDIYQAFINPKASQKTLMRHSRWASVLIVLCGLLFSLTIHNINEIWGWITMSIGAGMFIPTLVRWYWWRMNGYGFAIGTFTGMAAAIFQRLVFPHVPEYVSFLWASGISTLGLIAGTLLTRPTSQETLKQFYKTTRPFGFWNPVRKNLSSEMMTQINAENRRDIKATFFAVPWQITLFLMWMMVIMKAWWYAGLMFVIFAGLSIGLYLNWFRHLSSEVIMDEG